MALLRAWLCGWAEEVYTAFDIVEGNKLERERADEGSRCGRRWWNSTNTARNSIFHLSSLCVQGERVYQSILVRSLSDGDVGANQMYLQDQMSPFRCDPSYFFFTVS